MSYLTNTQVRTIIERTCKKASPNTYAYAQVPNRPNGSWVDEMGYGLIKVQAALRYASCFGWWRRKWRLLQPLHRLDEIKELIVGREHWEEWTHVQEVVRWPWDVADPMPEIIRYMGDDIKTFSRFSKMAIDYERRMLEFKVTLLDVKKEMYGELMEHMERRQK